MSDVNRQKLAQRVVVRTLCSSLPDARGFRHAYTSALTTLEDPLKKWVGTSMNKGPLFHTYKNLDEYEQKAIQIAVEDTIQREHGGSSLIAYRYDAAGIQEPSGGWGGYSLTTDPSWVRQVFNHAGSSFYIDHNTVKAFKVSANDVMLHWAMQMPTGWFGDFPLRVRNEGEIILKQNARPKEISLDKTDLR